MNTENNPSSPAPSILTSAPAPRKRPASRGDRLKELQKLPVIVQQSESKHWTLVPLAFPEFNDFYRL